MIVTRFAPSPTGRLHLGHAYSAALGHARARESGGKFRLRIEDLDQTRCQPEFVDGIYEDLRWLGLDWDEPVLVQSQRTAAIPGRARRAEGARPRLRLLLHARRHRAVADRAAWRCRDLLSRHLPRPARRSRAPRDHAALLAARFGARRWSWPACRPGPRRTAAASRRDASDIGDAILARKDAPASYHLVLRRRRCGERRDDGRARRRPARLDADPAPAADAARPARARPISTTRWSPTRTAAASPSATSRRRSRRCAKRASTAAQLAARPARRQACRLVSLSQTPKSARDALDPPHPARCSPWPRPPTSSSAA